MRRLPRPDRGGEGPPRQFDRIYEDHVWRVYGFLAYRTGDREAAEDLTQLTFERALRAWSRYDARRGTVSAWLLRIAHNALVDHLRRDRSALQRPLSDAPVLASPGPEGQLGVSAELERALAELEGREREVLALRYGADLSGAEVAELLGLTVSNVQQISSRALRRLRARLAPSELAGRE